MSCLEARDIQRYLTAKGLLHILPHTGSVLGSPAPARGGAISPENVGTYVWRRKNLSATLGCISWAPRSRKTTSLQSRAAVAQNLSKPRGKLGAAIGFVEDVRIGVDPTAPDQCVQRVA